MQIQKEEIRNRILDAAMDQFSLYGYKKVTMKTIAQKSEIAVGDIYAYFPSKEALLKCLLGDTVETLKKAIINDDFLRNPPSESDIETYSRELAKKFMKIRKPFLILIHNCEGSCYENVRSDLAGFACRRIIAEGPERFRDNPYIAEAIAIAVISGSTHIFCRCSHNYKLFSSTLATFMKLVIENISAR